MFSQSHTHEEAEHKCLCLHLGVHSHTQLDHETTTGWSSRQSLGSKLEGPQGRLTGKELAGKAKGIHLLRPSAVLPEELSPTDNGALINCYSRLTGSQPLHTQGTFLAGGLQINRYPCPGAACELQPCWIIFHFPASGLEAILFLSFLSSTSKIRSF